MNDDLIKRLKDTSVWYNEKTPHTRRRHIIDRLEAAAALEAANARINMLEGLVYDCIEDAQENEDLETEWNRLARSALSQSEGYA